MTMKQLPALLLSAALTAAVFSGCAGNRLTSGGDPDTTSPVSGSPFSAADDEAFAPAAENGSFALFVKPRSGEFYVKDKRAGLTYYSNPPDRESDPTKGLNKSNLNAQIWLHYVGNDNSLQITNNVVGSINKDGAKISRIPGGFRAEYAFRDLKITLSLEVTLCEEGVEVRIPVRRLREEGDYKVYNLHVFPYFGAGGIDSEGYMLVPDGSGAVILYNNQKQNAAEYRQKIYGRDNAFDLKTDSEVTQPVLLPVFGAKNGRGAFVAEIFEGEEYGYVNAFVSGQRTRYNSVYADFQFRQNYSYNLDNQTDIITYDKAPLTLKEIALRYCILPPEEADCAGMARAVRSRLFGERGVRPKEAEKRHDLFLEIVGSTRSRGFFLGVPVRTNTTLTPYERIPEMLRELETLGVENVLAAYTRATADSVADKISARISASRLLGSAAAFRRLKEFAENGDTVAFEVGLNRFSKSGNGVGRYFDVTRNLSGGISRQYAYRLSTYYPDKDAGRQFLLKPARIAERAARLLENEKTAGARAVFLGDFASLLYSDFDEERAGREVCKEQVTESLRRFADRFSAVAVRRANYYALPYVDAVFDVPMTSSRFKIEDYDVPFYQMVVSGAVEYAGPPLNLEPNERYSILKAAETGSRLCYRVLWNEKIDLSATAANDLLGGRFGRLKSLIAARCAELRTLDAATAGTGPVGHRRIREGVYETLYANGARVLINYTDRPAEIEGMIVNGMDFAVRTDGD